MKIDFNKTTYTNINFSSINYDKEYTLKELLNIINFDVRMCIFSKLGANTMYVKTINNYESFRVNNLEEDVSITEFENELSKYIRTYKINILK